jgi:hypothetical protein
MLPHDSAAVRDDSAMLPHDSVAVRDDSATLPHDSAAVLLLRRNLVRLKNNTAYYVLLISCFSVMLVTKCW